MKFKTVIAPNSRGLVRDLIEAWERREVLVFLALRDVSVRYKQTLLGVLWAVLQPLVSMVVFTFVFHRMARLDYGEIPPALFNYAGLLPWLLFQSSLQLCSGSVVKEKGLLTKVYFPRLLVPLSSLAVPLVDFLIALVILFGVMAYYGVAVSPRILLLPLLVGYALLSAFACGLWLTALNARFRDVRYTVPFLLRIWMFLSPVVYPSSKILEQIPAGWEWIYRLNPMVGVVDGFRWALLEKASLDEAGFLYSVAMIGVLFLSGFAYFRRTERTLVDLL